MALASGRLLWPRPLNPARKPTEEIDENGVNNKTEQIFHPAAMGEWRTLRFTSAGPRRAGPCCPDRVGVHSRSVLAVPCWPYWPCWGPPCCPCSVLAVLGHHSGPCVLPVLDLSSRREPKSITGNTEGPEWCPNTANTEHGQHESPPTRPTRPTRHGQHGPREDANTARAARTGTAGSCFIFHQDRQHKVSM